MNRGIQRSSEVSSWQSSMRAALYDGVTEADMAEIVKSLVARAKKGDLKAADLLFRWTMGQPHVAVVVERQDAPPTIDVTARLADDPTEEEIAERRLKIRAERESLRRI